MDFTPEQFTAIIAMGFGMVRIIETLVVKGFGFITGKKDTMSAMAEMLGKATNNHLHTIQEAVVTAVEQHKTQINQTERMITQHDKELEILARLDGKLSK